MHLQDFFDILDDTNTESIQSICGGNTNSPNIPKVYLYTTSLNALKHNISNFVSCLTSYEKNQANS